MNIHKIYKYLLLLVTGFSFHACVEPYDYETETFESAIVVEAVITNELKKHEILLSRTFRLEEEGPNPESNANIVIVDDANNTYPFQETSTPGRYLSLNEFKAEPNREYILKINTANGRSYVSEPTPLTSPTQMDLKVEHTLHDGEEGLAFLVNSYNANGTSQYYRYTYKETFKIVSPIVSLYDLIFIDESPVQVRKTKEETICYRTEASNTIILTNTTPLTEDRVDDFLIKFIDRNNPVIGHRYTILVKQYVLSEEAYIYMKTLKDLAGSESLFSQNQPGFISGNIFSVNNPQEKVLGYFNVSSVTSERVFLDYTDYFDPDEGAPPGYANNCDIFAPEWPSVMYLLQGGTVKFVKRNLAPDLGEGPYQVASTHCVDCTVLGSNVPPDFWIEE